MASHHFGVDFSQRGKTTIIALTGRSYDHLEIKEGGTASLEFLRVHFGDVPEAEQRRVRQALAEYCTQDTAGMIWIVEALRNLAVDGLYSIRR